MENNVIQFNKDDNFYFKKGSGFLRDGKITKAIDYFFKAKKKCRGAEIYLLNFMLAQAYFFNKNLELSNLYYFLSLKEELITQSVFRGLGENFAVQDDVILARFYLNQCANLGQTLLGQSAKERLKTLENLQPKFLVIDGDKSENITLENARNFMEEGKFSKAIELYEKNDNFSMQDNRSELALAYFFEKEIEKALKLLNAYGTDSVADLCNLLLIFHTIDDTKNYEIIREKLRNKTLSNEEDKFKIGLTFAQTGSLTLAIVYMEDYLSKNKTEDIELSFYYIIALMNDGQFEKAKRLLINLKTINPLDKYLFDHYLAFCNKGDKIKLEYVYSLPLKEVLKVQSKIKSYLVLSLAELKNVFLENLDFFYYYTLKSPPSSPKNLLLLKLATLEGDEFDEFFDIILLSDRIKTNLKNSIAQKRAGLDSTLVIVMTKDNIYLKIVLPNMQITKINNIHLHSAVLKSVDYILNETPPLSVSLNKYVIKIERRIKKDNVRDDILACFLCFESLKSFRVTNLSKICRHFKVLQQELYKFLDDYNFEV
ncbi:MAG: hypothetical protein EOM55_02665 [Clostridia bacterium]|nr:hypothetical protein [Clostridia bacterium]